MRTFGRHTHEQFGVGLILRGAQKSASGRGMVEACAGEIITVNPCEVHDGSPIGDHGRSWRMLYLDPAIVAELTADLSPNARGSKYEFTQPKIRDERLAHAFRELFQILTSRDASKLETSSTLLAFLASLLQPKSQRECAIPPGIAWACRLMEDDPASAPTLTFLAQNAGLSQYQFLRSFTRAMGLPPHAYLIQRRIHRARSLIRDGTSFAEVALACGFSDQSHMTRLFVRNFGISPGAYAKAVT